MWKWETWMCYINLWTFFAECVSLCLCSDLLQWQFIYEKRGCEIRKWNITLKGYLRINNCKGETKAAKMRALPLLLPLAVAKGTVSPRLESGNAGRNPACVLTALPSIKAAPKANCAALQAQGLKKQIDCEIRRPTASFSRTQHFQHGSPWIVDLILKTGF